MIAHTKIEQESTLSLDDVKRSISEKITSAKISGNNKKIKVNTDKAECIIKLEDNKLIIKGFMPYSIIFAIVLAISVSIPKLRWPIIVILSLGARVIFGEGIKEQVEEISNILKESDAKLEE